MEGLLRCDGHDDLAPDDLIAASGLDWRIVMQIDLDGSSPVMVVGGPYSNLRATRAAMAEAGRLGIAPERVIVTGDVVAYCAEPDETARAITGWGCHVIQGNCEQQIAAGAEDCACNFEEGSACDLLAKGWYPFTAARVSEEMRAWMAGLPEALTFTLAGLTCRVVHGGTREVSRWVFASEPDVLAEECSLAGADVVIAGHCGLPFIARSGPQVWFNAGVIGMPANDGTVGGWYGLITPTAEGLTLSTRRLAYDHQGAAAAMRRFGHANGYARTLVTGLWPSLDVLPPSERAATGARIKARSLKLAAKRVAAAIA